jgi:ABC-type antimicrobial peptide transport system permease subunit
MEIPNQYLCPISLQIMKNPHICIVDTYTYEYDEIIKYNKSPLTQAPFTKNDLILNRALKETIEQFLLQNPEHKKELYDSSIQNKTIHKNDIDYVIVNHIPNRRVDLETLKNNKKLTLDLSDSNIVRIVNDIWIGDKTPQNNIKDFEVFDIVSVKTNNYFQNGIIFSILLEDYVIVFPIENKSGVFKKKNIYLKRKRHFIPYLK